MKLDGDFYQIGVVVADIDRGMDHYRRLLGLGPFWRLDTDYEGRYRDWRGRFANRNAFTRWGKVYLEMIEPVLGEGNAKEWLETRGEGIFHLGYAVDDLGQRPDGVECVFESWGATLANGDAAVIHLDTVAQLGYFVELSDRDLVTRLNAGIDRFLTGQGNSARRS
jgi:methylmalonyl-CoA/ethylmalonyl-CoA epimerase